MKEFKTTWEQLHKITFNRKDCCSLTITHNGEKLDANFKFVKDIERRTYRVDDYYERIGTFVIKHIDSKVKYAAEYIENGDSLNDMSISSDYFTFIKIE